MEHVVFNEEEQKWYRHNDGVAVKVYRQGETIPERFAGVKASTYAEAFELLYGSAFAFA